MPHRIEIALTNLLDRGRHVLPPQAGTVSDPGSERRFAVFGASPPGTDPSVGQRAFPMEQFNLPIVSAKPDGSQGTILTPAVPHARAFTRGPLPFVPAATKLGEAWGRVRVRLIGR